ncbi:unnamed protein product [Haemonchus placei]|uniref:Uncharacterized protein n=1 Tax=Haemonchus placei TaxID=6290 RepID=A0A3P8CGX0_HAEPC|nr:unnamed protein product [Haemonchus placei]
MVRLQKILHPDWRSAINSSDSDLKIVTDFVKENNRYRDQLKDLNAFLHSGTVLPSTSQTETDKQAKKPRITRKTTVDASNIQTSGGPLGELSDEYEVQLVKSEGEAAEQDQSEVQQERRGRSRRQQSKTNKPRSDDRDK